ncbi:MAG: 2-oxoglutarate dehydrogenase complex dihydrolipoyllysine-residue succinyltransferase [Gammaproteobacteria bacterium]|nr:2-oxoglutarate dehydrogenase complex dihydrolipoyllysine-residue succinyltransferase [Gammaproteobacteria bacterium]
MSVEVKVPQLPESVADATLVGWHKQAGDSVRRDENLVDLETDKVVLEVPAPVSGVISEIKIEDGTTVTAGEVLAIIEQGEVADSKTPDAAQADGELLLPGDDDGGKQSDADGGGADDKSHAADSDADKLSPAVRRVVQENQVDAGSIKGSGKDGRLTKGDVLAHVSDSAAAQDTAPVPGSRNERRVPMTRMRGRIAERMVEAQSTAAMLTSFNEVDLTAVKALRAKYKETFQNEHGVKLGFMSFFVAAAVHALKKFPVVNASMEDKDVIYHDYYDVGIAVSTERGLVVPVLRNVENMTLSDIEQGIRNFAAKARDGKITLEELTGGTFSITNGGVFGSMMSTPILNMPQSAILGMHAIMDRPMAVNGQVEIRPMMYLALTYDHRIIDGADAVQFLVAIKQALEDPARILLQI